MTEYRCPNTPFFIDYCQDRPTERLPEYDYINKKEGWRVVPAACNLNPETCGKRQTLEESIGREKLAAYEKHMAKKRAKGGEKSKK